MRETRRGPSRAGRCAFGDWHVAFPLQMRASAAAECAPFDTAAPHSSRFTGVRTLFALMRQSEVHTRPHRRLPDCRDPSALLALPHPVVTTSLLEPVMRTALISRRI